MQILFESTDIDVEHGNKLLPTIIRFQFQKE